MTCDDNHEDLARNSQSDNQVRAALSRARTWEAQGEAGAAEMWRRDAERVRSARENLRREAEAEELIPPPADMSLRPPGDELII